MSTDLLEKAKPQLNPAASPVVAPAAKSTGTPSPAAPARSPKPSRPPEDDEDEPGFLKRHAVKLGIATVIIAGAVYAFSGPSKPHTATAPRKVAVPVNVEVAPPPPPPPPPPKVEPPKEQPKEEMEKETAPVEEPPEAPTPSDDTPPVTSNGPAGNDSFGLSKGKPGGGNGSGRKVGSFSKYGYYAGQVQSTISSAIKRNSKTKSSTMTITARIWADETGRVTRATLSGTSGDPAVDAALRDEVLTGLQLQSPPPEGMKMPINLKLTARAPQR